MGGPLDFTSGEVTETARRLRSLRARRVHGVDRGLADRDRNGAARSAGGLAGGEPADGSAFHDLLVAPPEKDLLAALYLHHC